MIALPHMRGVLSGGENIKEFAFIGSSTNNDNATAYTFSAVNIGSANSNRRVIIAFGSRAVSNTNYSILSATIGGVSATITSQHNATDDVGNRDIVAIITANIPTGTTGDVVITLSRSGVRAAIGVYRVVSSSPLTPIDTSNSSGSAIVNMSLDVEPQSIAIAVGNSRYFDSNGHTYTGISTRDVNIGVESGAALFSCASERPTSTSTKSITVTNNTYWITTVAASWK